MNVPHCEYDERVISFSREAASTQANPQAYDVAHNQCMRLLNEMKAALIKHHKAYDRGGQDEMYLEYLQSALEHLGAAIRDLTVS